MGLISIGKLSKQIGVSTITLRQWQREGKITPVITPGKHRRYSAEMVAKLLNTMEQATTEGEIKFSPGEMAAIRHEAERNDRTPGYMVHWWVQQALVKLGHGDAVVGPRETITLDELENIALDKESKDA